MANINWLAVLVAAVVYFAFGSLWYQVLLRKLWTRESGISMDNPPKGAAMRDMMVKSFMGNFLSAIGIALLLQYAHVGGCVHSMKIAAVAAFGIAGGTLYINYTWQSKSATLWAIDTGYTVIGCVLVAAIIGTW